LCGTAWFEEAVMLCAKVKRMSWHFKEGDRIQAGDELCTLVATKRGLLIAERTAINFLQLLSGVATRSRSVADIVAKHNDKLAAGVDSNSGGTSADTSTANTDAGQSGGQYTGAVKVLDTRKSIPNLRHAQKYAVRVGGCHNHRFSLNDALMVKENHGIAAGDLSGLVNKLVALRSPGSGKANAAGNNSMSYNDLGQAPVIVEVENLEQLESVLHNLKGLSKSCKSGEDATDVKSLKIPGDITVNGAKIIDVIMLDNFSIPMIKDAVIMRERFIQECLSLMPEFEISGAVTPTNLQDYLPLGVERISMGYLTKDYTALDFSLRFAETA
ncbi:MAG: hypothetical protein K0U41_06015, partial [Gammaproteobacteria bacterium]|nr:hypothetical protein [Gammaproteobacteria bacterium]